ncbi:MAG: tetratricopeptide repeat protein [Pseudomonadales bacterium]
MQIEDHLGLHHSCDRDDSVHRFDQVIDRYLRYATDTMDSLHPILEDDPTFATGHIFKSYQLKMASDPRFKVPLQQAAGALGQLELNDRESLHRDAIDAWLRDDLVLVSKRLAELLARYPTDLLALKAANHLHFYRGDAKAMRDATDASLTAWPEDHRWRSFVEGMLSFGYEETGHFERAEALGRAAVAADPMDMWAAHSVAHVLHMQSRWQEGLQWMDECLPHWQSTNNFTNHLHWHKALMLVDSGEAEAALQLYDDCLIRPLKDDFYLDVCNAASLLHRLEMRGLNVNERWLALSDYQHRITDQELVFITLHYVMIAARIGDKSALERGMASIDAWSDSPLEQGLTCQAVGKDLAEALALRAKGQTTEAKSLLEGTFDTLHTIGGSHAQRALFHELARNA